MKRILAMILVACAFIGTLIQTVGAEAIGDTYAISGFGLGWIMVGAVVVIAIIALLMQVSKKVIKPFIPVLAIVFIVGLALQYDIPSAPAEITDELVSGWEVTGNDITASGWITGTGTWDDEEAPEVLTLQLNRDNAGTGDGTYDEVVFVGNFTVDPTSGTGADTTKLVALHYKTDYNMKYSGEYVLDQSGGNYLANWSNSKTSGAKYYESSVDVTLDEADTTLQVAFSIDSGNDTVCDYLDAVGDTVSWTITLWDDYGWIDTYSVIAIVITND